MELMEPYTEYIDPSNNYECIICFQNKCHLSYNHCYKVFIHNYCFNKWIFENPNSCIVCRKTLYNFINSNHLHNYDIIPHDIENNIDSSFFIHSETRELSYYELRIIYKSLLIIIIIIIFSIKYFV
jgi:hypothetical protein